MEMPSLGLSHSGVTDGELFLHVREIFLLITMVGDCVKWSDLMVTLDLNEKVRVI